MNDADRIASLKDRIAEELKSVPMCVRSGGYMMAHEWKNRAEFAQKLCVAPRPKIADLENALFNLVHIDKYQPRQVAMNEQGRMK